MDSALELTSQHHSGLPLETMLSATQNPHVVGEYLCKETNGGNMFGPFLMQSAPVVYLNRFGVIPKKNHVDRWRLITDLSFPEGLSVNDAINPRLCSLSYITVDQFAAAALNLGNGALLAKIDIKAAYRLVPVHPTDRKWLGVKWEDHIYVDGMLPFGLRSAPKLFSAVADALEWCIAQGVQHVFHYLDDFVVLGPPRSPACENALFLLKKTCADLGVPLAPEKQDGPTSVIVFLGIIIDTVRQELRLPVDKLQRLMEMVSQWGREKACTRAELESLIGILQHAYKVVQPGRSFLGRAISLLSVTKQRHHHIRLNNEFRSDMMWWQTFATHWNGAALLLHPSSRTLTVTSGGWGCGAWHSSHWFQLAWDHVTCHWHIAAKELVPIMVLAVIWGDMWRGSRVVARCDNAAVVAVLKGATTRPTHAEVIMSKIGPRFQ